MVSTDNELVEDRVVRRRFERMAEDEGESHLVRVADLDDDLQYEAGRLSVHTALDGGALIETAVVGQLLSSRQEAPK